MAAASTPAVTFMFSEKPTPPADRVAPAAPITSFDAHPAKVRVDADGNLHDPLSPDRRRFHSFRNLMVSLRFRRKFRCTFTSHRGILAEKRMRSTRSFSMQWQTR